MAGIGARLGAGISARPPPAADVARVYSAMKRWFVSARDASTPEARRAAAAAAEGVAAAVAALTDRWNNSKVGGGKEEEEEPAMLGREV